MSFKDAVALIRFSLPNGNESRGTGFLVTSKHVLTALHVVAERRASSKRVGQPQPVTFVEPIPLRFSGVEPIERSARVVDGLWDPRQDWALLELDREVDIAPIAIGVIEGDTASWRTYGFPDTKPDGMMVEGRVRDSRGSIDGAPALQLFSEEAASGGGMPVRGLSGAPCVVHDTAIGILRWVPMANRATGQAHAGTVFACPLPVVAERCGDRLPALRTVSDQPQAVALIGLPEPAPRAHPAFIALMVALVAVVGVGGASATYLLTRPEPPRRDGDALYVAIRKPTIQAGQDLPEIELIRASLRQALLRSATNLSGLAVISDAEVDTLDDDKTSVSALARALAANEVIVSNLTCSPKICDVALSWVDDGGSVRQAESFTIEPPDDYRASLDKVTTYLHRGYSEFVQRPAIPEIQISNGDYEAFLRIKNTHTSSGISRTTDELLNELDEIRRRSDGFVEAYLLQAQILRNRYYLSREKRDIARAFELVDTAQQLAPGSPRPLQIRLQLILDSRELDLAEPVLRDLEELDVAPAEILYFRARLEQARGNLTRAIAVYAEAARERPSWRILVNLGTLQIKTAQPEEARKTLKQLLTIAPHNYRTLSLEAKLEMNYGSMEQAAELYEKLAARFQTHVSHANLGWARRCLGRFDEAVDSYQRVVESLPNSAHMTLNLGEAQELTGRIDDARRAYRRALELLDQDKSATDPRSLARRAVLSAHLERHEDAVRHIDSALNEAPDNVIVVEMAALVHALIGNRDVASRHVTRALDLGYNPQCFTVPWFDEVRRDPILNQRINRSRKNNE